MEVVQIVSVITSGCHGVGKDVKTPGDYIVQVRVIQSDGEMKKYNGEQLKALSANFGLFGCVYDVTFKMKDEIHVRTENKYINLAEAFLDANKLEELIEGNFSIEMFWFPFNSKFGEVDLLHDHVWVRQINEIPLTDPVKPYDAFDNSMDYLLQLCLHCAKPLYVNWPSLTPMLSFVAFYLIRYFQYKESKVLSQKLTDAIHFRRNIHMVPVRDMEFAFDMKKTDGETKYERVSNIIKVAIDKVDVYQKKKKFPLNTAVEMRFMGYSKSFLNPASIGNPEYNGSGSVFFIEVLSLTDTPDFEDFCIEVAKEWMKFDGVPHLAKEWEFIPGISTHMKSQLKRQISLFKEELTKSETDPKGLMTNAAIRELLDL